MDNALVNKIAAALWKAEAEDISSSTAERRTPEAFDIEGDMTRRKWRKLARAAISAGDIEEQAALLRGATGKVRDAVEGWDWWQLDPYDRDQSVASDAIEELRAFLTKLEARK